MNLPIHPTPSIHPDRSFSYDVVLSLNASRRLRECLPAIEGSLSESKVLAVTLNHRLYTLYQKNLIKGSLEAHGFDHLHFSTRPSTARMIAESEALDAERYKDLAEVVFVLQIMARHHIRTGIVEGLYLSTEGSDAVGVQDIAPQLLTFLDDIEGAFPSVNAYKQFPWLMSVRDVLPLLTSATLTLVETFPRDPLPAGYTYDDEQISPLEKDLFWVGFDPSFKDVPADRPYPPNQWSERAEGSQTGEPLFGEHLRYCIRCCLPETMEGISFDEMGVCTLCRSSEEKMHISWEERRKKLDSIVDSFRSDDFYDCMLPMSGGKDSTFQAHLLKHVLDVTPLSVTHGQNWLSVPGRYNLENCLQQFDFDHVMFNMNRRVINRVARKSLRAIGDACWHCHIGAGTFPLQVALAWNVRMMCWGESIAEADGRSSYSQQEEASLYYFLEVSARVTAEEMVGDDVSSDDISPWMYPSSERLDSSGIRFIHLGDYFFWDEERQVEFIKRNYEWMDAPVENTYKHYKSVECVMAGVHDYANFIKRGIGRATIHASDDVRRGLLTREEGFELAKTHDVKRPHALDFYLELTGLSEDEFEDTLAREARARSEFARKMDDV